MTLEIDGALAVLILFATLIVLLALIGAVTECKQDSDVADYVGILTRENVHQAKLIEQLSKENQELKHEIAKLVNQLEDSGS